jgi:hypothetical protein
MTITLHGPFWRRSHPVPMAIVGAQTLIQLAAIPGFVAVQDWRVAERAFVPLRHGAENPPCFLTRARGELVAPNRRSAESTVLRRLERSFDSGRG